jgi:hypothetical protein
MSASTAFLSGWRSLPDELKLQIIKYALPAGGEYDKFPLERWLYSYKWREEVHNHGTPLTHTSKPSTASQWCKIGGRPGVVRRLSPFYAILTVPELQGLAIYSQNTIDLRQESEYACTKWPPPGVRGYVRRLEIGVHCYKPSVVDFLNKVAGDMSGLNHLHHTKLILQGKPDEFAADVMDALDPIGFPTKVLEVSLQHDCRNGGTTCVRLEGFWLDKLTVRGDQSKTTVRLERYFVSMLFDLEEDPREFVEDWPVIMPDDAWRCMDRVVSI